MTTTDACRLRLAWTDAAGIEHERYYDMTDPAQVDQASREHLKRLAEAIEAERCERPWKELPDLRVMRPLSLPATIQSSTQMGDKNQKRQRQRRWA